ncbi:MAG: sugar transferase related protein [Microgenomates bacterium 39_7]|nr:MAG: sugar transferase related protein [Microgenomates bacterium 39_7]
MAQKVSLIVTVLNEEKTIKKLLEAIAAQTKTPDELIIVDGKSSDKTIKIIRSFINKQQKINTLFRKNFVLKILPNSNRAQARNWAIKNAKHPLIAITDAGCVPQPNWLANLVSTYQKNNSPIVGGYFYGLPSTPFEQAVVTYTLEMPDRVNPDSFIPTTRSVLITKKVWQELGKFDEKLTTNEDFPFFFFARQQGIGISFAKNALVGWMPRKNLKEFSKMIFGFAKGDIEAGIIRPKVQLLFGRYLLVLMALLFLIFGRGIPLLQLLPAILFWLLIYLLWAIWKNIKYVPDGWYWLPIMQLLADATVMAGSISGLVNRYRYQPQTQ